MADPVDGKAVVAALAENVLKTRFEDFTPAVIDNTKKRILDVIGCAIGGAAAPGDDALIELVKSWGRQKRGDYPRLRPQSAGTGRGLGRRYPVPLVRLGASFSYHRRKALSRPCQRHDGRHGADAGR